VCVYLVTLVTYNLDFDSMTLILHLDLDNLKMIKAIVTSSSAMAERPRELDQRFQVGGQFEAKL